jgi:hypothetical protein
MVTPCNMHINKLADEAEKGVNSAGGKGVIFKPLCCLFFFNLCRGNDLFIVNGRIGDNKEGNLTCRNASVVDYTICSSKFSSSSAVLALKSPIRQIF